MLYSNPNDNSAHIYDIVNKPLKGQEVTEQEIDLIKSLVPPKGTILDIGCGTGRHAVPLVQNGFNVTGIDSSKEMLNVLKKKNSRTHIVYKNIFDVQFKENYFDLIIMMWNVFNEIALTEDQAEQLLLAVSTWLKPEGKVLINIDNPSLFNPATLTFQTESSDNGVTYLQRWKVISYNPQTNMTVSEETLDAIDKKGKNLEHIISHITQRWWEKEEIEFLCKKVNFTLSQMEIKTNQEFYFILKKKQ
jgi:ubiquinone/menaquinone biosynthesis C-methylase UbiE